MVVIHPAEGGKLTITFTSQNDRTRTLIVPADRLFERAFALPSSSMEA